MGFEHSVKVPTQYRKAAKVLKKCMEEDVSVKNVLYSQVKHADINKLYALIAKIFQMKGLLNQIIEDSEIFQQEPRLDQYLGRILIAELLIGKQMLNGNSKPVETVRRYEPKLRELYNVATTTAGRSVPVIARVNNPRYVRVNTLKLKRDQFLEIMAEEGWYLQPAADSYDAYLEKVPQLATEHFIADFHIPNLFTFPANSKRYWATHELVKSSSVLLQDKSSCLAPYLLSPSKKSVILDMCAAPGLKTIFLAALIKNRGRIHAVEKMRIRFETLRSFVESSGSTSVHPIEADTLRITQADVPDVEYILLDPSCSGSGIVQRFDDVQAGEDGGGSEEREERLDKLSRLQLKMLLHAMTEFPKVKRILYSTCSINPEENEAVVQKALKQCKQFKLVQPDLPEWKNYGASSYKKVGKKCVYCRPEVDLTNGFFIALIEKKDQMDVDEGGE